MNADFSTVYNHQERLVFEAVSDAASRYAHLDNKPVLADIACVALNRLPPRYIRHEVDFAFYLSDRERVDNDRAVQEAVSFAFEFVQARSAMRVRV